MNGYREIGTKSLSAVELQYAKLITLSPHLHLSSRFCSFQSSMRPFPFSSSPPLRGKKSIWTSSHTLQAPMETVEHTMPSLQQELAMVPSIPARNGEEGVVIHPTRQRI